ncbi:DHH family phosphoesterase [Candidatus Bathyarchaeota archaeon]|nr:MAG: DHH family phosphoesterase [Candidatus Bathyarchaeota archaeon]
MEGLRGFQDKLGSAASAVRESGIREAVVLHHDEADGLTSAALTKLALSSLGLNTRLICLDKLFPEVIKDLESGHPRIIAYVDLGSGHVDWLIKANSAKGLILVLDHHDTISAQDPLLYNLNPELYGFSGEKDASSATVAYLFCKTVDPKLSNYAHLATIGSLELPGETQGLNLIAMKDAKDLGLVRDSGGSDLKIAAKGVNLGRARASSLLNVLGSVGYYRKGPEMGIEACTTGFADQTMDAAKEFEEERKAANREMLVTIKKDGLSQKKNVQWFHAHDNYKGMGGKVVGSFCSYLRYQRGVNPVKYLIGMMNVPADIPGWGKLPSSMIKVSGRAPQILTSLIEKGTKPSLSKILPESCSKVGGFGDGHSVAASGVFPVGKEEMFLNEIDRLAV